jgi:hypothetical protein
MAYCISLHTADYRIGLYHLLVKTIHRSQPSILTVALSVKLVALSAELAAVRVYEQGRLIRSQTLLIPLPYDVLKLLIGYCTVPSPIPKER